MRLDHPSPSEIHAMARELFEAAPGALTWDGVLRDHEAAQEDTEGAPGETALSTLRAEAVRAFQLGARLPGCARDIGSKKAMKR